MRCGLKPKTTAIDGDQDDVATRTPIQIGAKIISDIEILGAKATAVEFAAGAGASTERPFSTLLIHPNRTCSPVSGSRCVTLPCERSQRGRSSWTASSCRRGRSPAPRGARTLPGGVRPTLNVRLTVDDEVAPSE